MISINNEEDRFGVCLASYTVLGLIRELVTEERA